MIILDVPGIPRPQPRPRLARGRVVSTMDGKAKAWADSILRAAHAAKAYHELKGPVAVTLLFRFPTRDKARHGNPHLHVPDADNLAKLALDAIQRSGLLPNDSAVWSLRVLKVWAKPGDEGMAAALSSSADLPKDELAATPPTPPAPPSSPQHPRWLN